MATEGKPKRLTHWADLSDAEQRAVVELCRYILRVREKRGAIVFFGLDQAALDQTKVA